MGLWRRISPRRSQLRKSLSTERFWRITRLANIDVIISLLLWVVFVSLCIPILSLELIQQGTYGALISQALVIGLICLAAAFYICFYQGRVIKNHARALALACLFISLLVLARLGQSLATATAVSVAIILTIAYDQRFALGMSIFYCLLACFAAETRPHINLFFLFLVMASGAFTCCLSLREIRNRMKLLTVSTVASAIVFMTAATVSFLAGNQQSSKVIFRDAGYQAISVFLAGLLIQSLLPLIEKIFRIATSMTLLDFSDANQPLLKRLAMEAPGTFSHSLLIGSLAESAAQAIGRNGLLCRVGAYYHDIGKINKAGYFVENQMGSASRHKELSPAMSHLIIVGHVKDGIEMAKEYGLPSVLRQFIETHHGTTLVEHFYNEAKKLQPKNAKAVEAPSESEFRYPGPKPKTKEAAIVMLADTIEGAVRSLAEVTPTRVEAVVHNMAMKRLQDGQFDECDLSLRELSQIEASISKTLAAHYHGRIAYPKAPDVPDDKQPQPDGQKND